MELIIFQEEEVLNPGHSNALMMMMMMMMRNNHENGMDVSLMSMAVAVVEGLGLVLSFLARHTRSHSLTEEGGLDLNTFTLDLNFLINFYYF